MKVKKSVKKAQSGKQVVTERRDLNPKHIDIERERIAGPKAGIDTAARRKAIGEGRFREDPKTGDLYELPKNREPKRIYPEASKKKNGGKMKKAKSGASLKPVPPAKKKSLGKLPKAVRNKMGFQKSGGKTKKMMGGGKCKYGC